MTFRSKVTNHFISKLILMIEIEIIIFEFYFLKWSFLENDRRLSLKIKFDYELMTFCFQRFKKSCFKKCWIDIRFFMNISSLNFTFDNKRNRMNLSNQTNFDTIFLFNFSNSFDERFKNMRNITLIIRTQHLFLQIEIKKFIFKIFFSWSVELRFWIISNNDLIHFWIWCQKRMSIWSSKTFSSTLKSKI